MSDHDAPAHAQEPAVGAGVRDQEWDIWRFVLRVAGPQAFMDAVLSIDDRVVEDPIPDCCESGVCGEDLFELVIEQPQPEARRQVEALIAHLGLPAQLVEVRRGE